jgi:hypothetical protein
VCSLGTHEGNARGKGKEGGGMMVHIKEPLWLVCASSVAESRGGQSNGGARSISGTRLSIPSNIFCRHLITYFHVMNGK